MGGLLVAAFAALRRARLRAWGVAPLEFEDEIPPPSPRSIWRNIHWQTLG